MLKFSALKSDWGELQAHKEFHWGDKKIHRVATKMIDFSLGFGINRVGVCFQMGVCGSEDNVGLKLSGPSSLFESPLIHIRALC